MYICPRCYDPSAISWKFPKVLEEKCSVETEVERGSNGEVKIGAEILNYNEIRELKNGIMGDIGAPLVNAFFALLCSDSRHFWSYVNSEKITAAKVTNRIPRNSRNKLMKTTHCLPCSVLRKFQYGS